MASLKERLADTCICGHAGSEHTAIDRGTHIALDGCTYTDLDTYNGVTGECTGTKCSCTQFRRVPKPGERAGKQNLPAHGKYSKSHYRI